MDNKILYIGLIVIIAAVGVVAYFDYNIYSEKQMQTYMIQAAAYNNTALGYNTTLQSFITNKDYDGCIKVEQVMMDNYQKAIEADNNAMKYASGIYKNYITYDIMRLNMDIKLGDKTIQLFKYAKAENINGMLSLTDSIKEYNNNANDYRNKEDEILTANPDKFKFLNN